MTTITYVVSAYFLLQAWRRLCPPERVLFVTGVPLVDNNVIVLTDFVEVGQRNSAVRVDPDPASIFQVHQELLALGLDIQGQFHSHPGSGPNATRPSHVDLGTARRWEDGAPFIAAIFSEDAHVRFFNFAQQSVVHVHGKVLQTEEALLFQLTDSQAAQDYARRTAGSLVDRSSGAPRVVELAAMPSGNDLRILA